MFGETGADAGEGEGVRVIWSLGILAESGSSHISFFLKRHNWKAACPFTPLV
jgi:hypothetical protein